MGGLFSRPKPPKIEPPAPMPDPEDEVRQREQRRMAAAAATQTGRRSTMLSSQQGVGRQTLGAG